MVVEGKSASSPDGVDMISGSVCAGAQRNAVEHEGSFAHSRRPRRFSLLFCDQASVVTRSWRILLFRPLMASGNGPLFPGASSESKPLFPGTASSSDVVKPLFPVFQTAPSKVRIIHSLLKALAIPIRCAFFFFIALSTLLDLNIL